MLMLGGMPLQFLGPERCRERTRTNPDCHRFLHRVTDEVEGSERCTVRVAPCVVEGQ